MNNIKKSIFKTQTENSTPPVNISTYSSGNYLCSGGFVSISSPTPRGSIYYVGDFGDLSVSGVFINPELTIPVPYDYIRTNTTPRYYMFVNTSTGSVGSVQGEGDPC